MSLIVQGKMSQVIAKRAAAVFLAAIFLYSNTAYAVTVNIGTMIQNFADTVPNLMRLVTAVAYVMGMYFCVYGIVLLKQYGESRTMMSGQIELKKPLIYLFVGAGLLYLPSSVRTGIATFWNNPTPYAYVTDSTDSWSELISNIFMIIQFIGTIAFIRGLILLTHISSHGQPGTFARAMSHIIGGVLCINMYQFIQAVSNTLALST